MHSHSMILSFPSPHPFSHIFLPLLSYPPSPVFPSTLSSATSMWFCAWSQTTLYKRTLTLILTHTVPHLFVYRSPRGSPSHGGDVAVYIYDINQPSLPTPFQSVLVSVSVFKALSTVFHSINSPVNSPFSHSVPPVLFLPYWYFQLYISL